VLFLLLPDNKMYGIKDTNDIELFVEEQLLKGRPVKELIVEEIQTPKSVEAKRVTEEERIVLKRAGKIDPKNIEEYIALDGYQGFAKALEDMTRVCCSFCYQTTKCMALKIQMISNSL